MICVVATISINGKGVDIEENCVFDSFESYENVLHQLSFEHDNCTVSGMASARDLNSFEYEVAGEIKTLRASVEGK